MIKTDIEQRMRTGTSAFFVQKRLTNLINLHILFLLYI